MRFIALVSALAAVPAVAGAQPAQTFADLAGLVALEEGITVTTEAGETIEGSALAVSPSSIHLLVGGDRVVLREPDVRWVRQRWDDPLRDGYLTGFATGAGALWGIGVVFIRLEGELPTAGVAFRMSVASCLTGLLGAWDRRDHRRRVQGGAGDLPPPAAGGGGAVEERRRSVGLVVRAQVLFRDIRRRGSPASVLLLRG